MKKMAAFLMAFTLVCTSSPADLHTGAATETVYAAQAVAISSEEDLVAMQENPDGNYYLAKDITIKGNLNLFPNYYDYDTKVQHEECFTGSLDGKGHTIKNYTGMGLFNNAKNATFKNIVMTNVTVQGKEMGAALLYQAEKCRFSNITVSGKAAIGGAGIVDSAKSCDFTDCTSKVNADIKVTDALPGFFAGISWGDENSNFRNCRNQGNITLTGAWNEDTSFSVYGIAMITKKIEKCVNTGNLTIKNTAKGDAGFGLEFEACGVAGSCYGQAKGCGNTGKISVTNQGGKTSRAVVKVCGIEASAVKIKQCYNKGAVSFTGVCSGRDYEGDNEVAGVGFAASMSECYNTGKITVNTKNGFTNVGGVSYCGTKIKNCYNTGTVSLTGKGYAGSVVGEFRDGSCNYNVGKVTAKGKYAMAGEIAGYVSGENTVSDNYYTGSGKKSGREYTSWVPYQSKAKKVSSITSANCPKLSSKYWTYSGKHKRLILKNNKEA